MNITKFVNLKVCAVAAFSCAATVGVQHWRTSESLDNVPPPMREERDERQKKFEFEVQQRSEQLNKKEQTLKALEETLAKREAALKEERSALQYMQAKSNAPSESETVAVQGVREEVSKVVESTTVKVAHPDPVVPPQEYVPRRPQVFDGHGNAPAAPKASVTNEPRLLYFHDPSFATDGSRYDPAIPLRDIPLHLADMFKRRRFANLQPQHVVSFRATKDGWSLETQDGVSNGAYAPATEIEHVIDSTAAGATRGSERGDATVVTLHGHDPKPPSDGRSAVSEAERNAFNEERRIFEAQRKAFDREKNKKEKELADKEKDLEVRKKFLDLREENKDDAADLFDLEEPRVVIGRAENFNIPRRENEPYEIAKQNEEGMTIKAKSKDPNIVRLHLNFEIAGKKQPFEKLEKENGELFVSGKKKDPLSIQEGDNWAVLRKEKASYKIEKSHHGMTIERQPKPELVYENRDSVEINAGKKEPYKKQSTNSINLCDKEREKTQIENINSINLLSPEKPKNEIGFGKSLTVLAAYDPEDEESKAPLLVEKTIGFNVRSEPKKASYLMSKTRAIALSGAQSPYVKKRPIMVLKAQKQGSCEKKTLQPEQTKEVTLSASEKSANKMEYGDRLKILPNPKSKPEFKKTTLESFTVNAAGRKPYKTEYIDAIELAGEEPKKNENTITSDKGFEIQAKPSAKAVKPNLALQQFNFSLSVKKKVDPTVTDTFKTPSKRKDNDTAQSKVKTKKSQRDLLNLYDEDGLLDGYFEEDEESEKEEKVVPGREVSAFTLDEKPVAKNKISKTESIQILQKKEKSQLIPTDPAVVEVKAMQKQPRKFEISKMQSITAEAQAVETKESATETQKPMKFDDLKSTKAVLESVLRTKDSRDTEVQTADKVPLFTKSTSLFIEKEKSSKDLIIDLDEDEASVSEEAEAEKVQKLFQIEYPKFLKSVRELKESVKFGEPNAGATETLSELRKKQQMLQKKIEDFEKTFHKPYFQTHHGFVCELSDELDAIGTMLQGQKPSTGEPKATEVNNMFKPGWSVLKMNSINTAGGTFEGEKQPKSSPKFFCPWPTNKICFIGKSPVMIDSEIQMGEPRVSEYLQPEHTNTIVGDGSETEKVRKEAETLREKLREFDGMDRKVVERFRDKTLEEVEDVLLGEMERNTKELSEENGRLKRDTEILEQEIERQRKALEEENNETIRWSSAVLNISDEVEKLKKLLSKNGSLNPGAEVPKCEDRNECDRAEILYKMTRLLRDLFIRVTDKSLTREVLDEAKENFEFLKESYTPCTCENEDCEKLREEREAYIAEVEKALKNAERFLPSALWKAKTSERFLPSKPKAFSPSKPKKTESVSVQTDIGGKFFKEAEAEHQALLKQIADLEKEKEEIETLEQISAIQVQEGNKAAEANQELLGQIKGLEEQNERLQREKEELRKNLDKATEEFSTIMEFGNKDREDLLEEIDKKKTDIARLQKELQTKDSEKEAKEEQLQKREEELRIQREENRQLILLQNPINEPEEWQRGGKKNDEKKKGEGKKLKKQPKNRKIIKEIDDSEKGLKKAGKKHEKEADEAENEMSEFMQKLENTEDVDQLKKGIMALLDYAQKRLPLAAKTFKLEDTENFVKTTRNIYGNDAKQIAQKNVSESFVRTVSFVQGRIMELWKRITVILKPKAVSMGALSKATADEEEKKINLEAERRKRAVVQEKDTEIAKLKKKLEEMERKLKQQTLDAKIMRHMKAKTETNLLHEANVSPLYNFNDTSNARGKKKRDDGRNLTRVDILLASNKSLVNSLHDASYSRDYSKQQSGYNVQTPWKKHKNSGSYSKYRESLEKGNLWTSSYAEQQERFTELRDNGNFLASIEEAKDEIHGNDHTTGLPEIRKAGKRLLNLIASWRVSTQEATYDSKVPEAIDSWKNETEKVLLLIGGNEQTSVEQPLIFKEKQKRSETPNMEKNKSGKESLYKTQKRPSNTKKNLGYEFDNAKSSPKTKGSGLYSRKIVRYENPDKAVEQK